MIRLETFVQMKLKTLHAQNHKEKESNTQIKKRRKKSDHPQLRQLPLVVAEAVAEAVAGAMAVAGAEGANKEK